MGCCSGSEVSPQNETPRGKSCTDLLWLIIYILFWILMIIVSAVSFIYGNPLRIINGFDSYGNTCGVKPNPRSLVSVDTSDKPYLFFMDVNHLRKSLKICVKKCPDQDLDNMQKLTEFYQRTGSNLCNYSIAAPSPSVQSSQYGPCPALPVPDSFPLLNRCVPKKTKLIAQKVVKDFSDLLNSWDTLEQMLADVHSSWKEMLICVIIAFIVSLLMVSILHLLATFVSYIFMIAVSITSVIGSGLLWYTYYELKTGKRGPVDAYFLSETLRNESAFLWYSIIATVITLILLILVFVMRSRVNFLAALFKETANCLASIPGLFLQPIITFVILSLFFAFWSLVVACLATASYPGIQYNVTKADGSGQDKGLHGMNIKFEPSWVKGMWWVCIICLVWTSEFILACQQMTIAGAVSHWYFRGARASSSPVLFAIGKLVKYHLGSVAKGSFIITIFKIPRLIMTYLHAKLKSRAEKGSDCAQCGLKGCICCFYLLEKFIRYLNHNAYTIITIERVHFCKAAGIAFSTLVNNALQVATINSVGDFILFLGKCIVTAVTGSIGLLLLKRNPDLHLFAVPTLLICVFSFFIAHCVLSLYEMVVDTLFLCVCEDRNLNGEEGRWRSSRLAELGGGDPPLSNEEIAQRKHHQLAAAPDADHDETDQLQDKDDKF